MVKIILYVLFIIIPSNVHDVTFGECLYSHVEPLENEYQIIGIPNPSCGFYGSAVPYHSKSAYLSSFWNKVYTCQISYGGTITSGYRCPVHNYQIGGVPMSVHQYGNAADIGCSNPSSLLEDYEINFDFPYSRIYSSHFHIDDRTW